MTPRKKKLKYVKRKTAVYFNFTWISSFAYHFVNVQSRLQISSVNTQAPSNSVQVIAIQTESLSFLYVH